MDKIAVLDFGGQYAHLIANRIRRLGVYSEIFDGTTKAARLEGFKGIVLSGGPASLTDPKSVKCDKAIFNLGIPILGICYGHQLLGYYLGGKVHKGRVREYGPAKVKFSERKNFFKGIKPLESVWMSHFDQVIKAPKGFKVVGKTSDCPIAAMADYKKHFYGIQFHPEVTHTPCGNTLLKNFIEITCAKKQWSIDRYIKDILQEIKIKANGKKVFLMISGGVDSTVAFLLLAKALGQNKVYGLFVDTGFMRMNEGKEVAAALKKVGVKNLHVYDASKEYFSALKGVYDPEEKRKIIGNLFLKIQEKVSNELKLNPKDWLLGQGTIYPDTIETGGTKHADKIKTHHNQIERIKELDKQGKIIEPLKQLYKDEVRMVGKKLGLKENMVWRHPFPGPALAVRILCAKKSDLPLNAKELENKINNTIRNFHLKAKILPIKSVGVQGDERTYKHPVMIYGKFPGWDRLSVLSTQLTNRFSEVNRVVFGLYPNKFNTLDTQNSCLTKPRVLTIQKADKIVMDFIETKKIQKSIWQFPTVLIPLSINHLNGESVVLRPVCSEEAMTANFYQMSSDKLKELTKKLPKVKGVAGVFYDITNKPPATIEWE